MPDSLDDENITALLGRWDTLDEQQRGVVFGVLYDELRSVARGALAGNRDRMMLQPTALVHEAYLRLVGARNVNWKGRGHFIAIAGRSMRQVLVDAARHDRAAKRDRALLTTLGEDLPDQRPHTTNVLDLDDALVALESVDPLYVRVVEARVFAGASIEEAAEALAISPATLKRKWRIALAWLYDYLEPAS